MACQAQTILIKVRTKSPPAVSLLSWTAGYSKFQKYVPFDIGSKSPLSPLFQRGERFTPIGLVVAIGEFMQLQASLRPPFTKGGQGDFYGRILPCQSEHIYYNSYNIEKPIRSDC